MKNYEEHLIEEAKKIVQALGKMFAPFCEVVLHDLRTPQSAIIHIENNLSARKIGDATTNIGLERLTNSNFPAIVQNYPNELPNGKKVKSTSIGITNLEGKYIASICLNFDLTSFQQINNQFIEFIKTNVDELPMTEQFKALSADEIHQVILKFAGKKGKSAQALTTEEKKEVVNLLEDNGAFQMRNAVKNIAKILGVTRPTIYSYLKLKG